MTASRSIDVRTRDAQHRASNPAHSAWVSAHAGSGKTHVLAARVVRLLLDGVAPARILCLTFTKAGAANMTARVFKILSEWAVADDGALRESLGRLGAHSAVSLDDARRLFARAVETPGGLKIQTIHAFCERVLHLFPFEANVPADFRVIEETEQSDLLTNARNAVLFELAARDDDSRGALALVSEGMWEGGFVALVGELFTHRSLIESVSDAESERRLRAALGLDAQVTTDELRPLILQRGLPQSEWSSAADALDGGSQNDRDFAARLRKAALQSGDAAVTAYFDVFRRKNSSDWLKTGVTKKFAGQQPALAQTMADELIRLPPLRETWQALQAVTRMSALRLVAQSVFSHYDRAKSARALLDFDDLIVAAHSLLTRHTSSWVLYKLDGGIDHILVDEAQDTSEPQWEILEALAQEFTAGEGRSQAHRTFFAVGDEKQSIFSFQGAAPKMFDVMRRRFATSAGQAQRPFEPVSLHTSFRSAPEILNAVDELFRDEARRRGLWTDPAAPVHQALKSNVPGLVEIWPLLAADDRGPPDSWLLPVDAAGDHEPPAKLAQKIATKIEHLLDHSRRQAVEGDRPGSSRAITPGDIMILVRRRDAFFEAVIRTLKDRNIAVAGADRLDVVGHIAVMDCAAAGRVALLPDDDLSLATVLKSPLIGLDDDDLIALAPGRRGSLHDALCRSTEPHHQKAAARIARWRAPAPHRRPFAFFSHILGAEGGRRALLARLGAEANDALDEFLALAIAHERVEAPSLVTFLATLETLAFDVKRDLEAAHDAVRVMTVHAAKGLESKIVFLPDTCGAPGGLHDPKLYALATAAGSVIAWSAGAKKDPAALVRARDDKRLEQDGEYRRLLYVAMTRAEERLYIAGHYNKRPPGEECWHALVSAALLPGSETVLDDLEAFGEIWRRGKPRLLDDSADRPTPPQAEAIPHWLMKPMHAERSPLPPLRPSSALSGADGDTRGEGVAQSAAQMRGLATHALLQVLPDISPLFRHAKGQRVLAESWPNLFSDHDTILTNVLAVIDHAKLAVLFGENALAEVEVAATVKTGDGRALPIVGRIDRLVEANDAIILAEFKSGAAKAATRSAHVAQIALYAEAMKQIRPSKRIEALLVYVTGLDIVELSEADLNEALSDASLVSVQDAEPVP